MRNLMLCLILLTPLAHAVVPTVEIVYLNEDAKASFQCIVPSLLEHGIQASTSPKGQRYVAYIDVASSTTGVVEAQALTIVEVSNSIWLASKVQLFGENRLDEACLIFANAIYQTFSE